MSSEESIVGTYTKDEVLSHALYGARERLEQISCGDATIIPEVNDALDLTGRAMVFAGDNYFILNVTVEDMPHAD